MDIKERIKIAIEKDDADMEKLNDLFSMVRQCEDAGGEVRVDFLCAREGEGAALGGGITESGMDVDNDNYGLRPAMWITLPE